MQVTFKQVGMDPFRQAAFVGGREVGGYFYALDYSDIPNHSYAHVGIKGKPGYVQKRFYERKSSYLSAEAMARMWIRRELDRQANEQFRLRSA